MTRIPDIDIDFADRDLALEDLLHIPASRMENGAFKKHNVGVYFQDIPTDAMTGWASLPYKEAESRGYFKIDFLNLHIYNKVRDEEHLLELMEREPEWDILEIESVVNELFHINGHFDVVESMKPRTIEQMAMVLALIRPAKRHLVGRSWAEVEAEIWTNVDDDKYGFKKAHALSYSYVVIIQMNLFVEQALDDTPLFSQL
jgi:hypothetical protein